MFGPGKGKGTAGKGKGSAANPAGSKGMMGKGMMGKGKGKSAITRQAPLLSRLCAS